MARLLKPALGTCAVDIVKPKACTACRIRKVKCNRTVPCSNCTGWAVDCVYPPPKRTCRRRPRAATGLAPRTAPKTAPHSAAPARPAPFPLDTFPLDLAALHPRPNHICKYYCVFLRSIDPLIKVLHRPTTELLLQRAVSDPASLKHNESAVLLTLYLSALSAMSAADAEASSGLSRSTALATFKGAAEHALMRANFLAAADLTTLQAFVLYLSLHRFSDDAYRVYALTALGQRLADTSPRDPSPLDRELRIRLRWELWCMDHRAHEDALGHGDDESRLLDARMPDTLPMNVQDADIGSPTAVSGGGGWTEVSFSLVCFEIAIAYRRLPTLPPQQRGAAIDACERRVQDLYLGYCDCGDDAKPIQWLARHVGHVLLMEMRFRVRMRVEDGGLGVDAENMALSEIEVHERRELFLEAVDILDVQQRVRVEPLAAEWSWLLPAYLQFWPLAFVLGELGRYGVMGLSDVMGARAWEVAKVSLRRWDLEGNQRGSRRVEVLKVLVARVEGLWEGAANVGVADEGDCSTGDRGQLAVDTQGFFSIGFSNDGTEVGLGGVVLEESDPVVQDFLVNNSAMVIGEGMGWDDFFIC